jgi:hypothetical protein
MIRTSHFHLSDTAVLVISKHHLLFFWFSGYCSVSSTQGKSCEQRAWLRDHIINQLPGIDIYSWFDDEQQIIHKRFGLKLE